MKPSHIYIERHMASSQFNNAYSIETGTINGNLGFTINWVKCGRIVQLSLSNGTTKIPQGDSLIATLPNSLKPKYPVHSDCYKNDINKCAFLISNISSNLALSCSIPTGTSSPYYVSGTLTYIV